MCDDREGDWEVEGCCAHLMKHGVYNVLLGEESIRVEVRP